MNLILNFSLVDQDGFLYTCATAGTAGRADGAAPPFSVVVINEVLTHTDPPAKDSIELHNPGGEPVEALVVDISKNPWTGMMVLEEIRRRDWATPVFIVSRYITKAMTEEARRLDAKSRRGELKKSRKNVLND